MVVRRHRADLIRLRRFLITAEYIGRQHHLNFRGSQYSVASTAGHQLRRNRPVNPPQAVLDL